MPLPKDVAVVISNYDACLVQDFALAGLEYTFGVVFIPHL